MTTSRISQAVAAFIDSARSAVPANDNVSSQDIDAAIARTLVERRSGEAGGPGRRPR